MKKLLTVLLLVVMASVSFFFIKNPGIPPSQKAEQYFKQKLSATISKLTELQVTVNNSKSNKEIQEAFRRARLAYKQLELLIEYYYPSLIRKVNCG